MSDESQNNGPTVPLLKLHGSTNWAICGCNQIHVLGTKVTKEPQIFRSMRCGSCQQQGLRLLLVQPSWDKSEYSKVIQPVWAHAVEALKTATRICVIGYSMPETDAFLKFLLALGLAENDRLYKLIVVDWLPGRLSVEGLPTQSFVEQKWRTMLENLFVDRRFEFSPLGYGGFIRSSIQHLLGRGEQIA